MRLRTRLMLLIGVAAIGPLAMVGVGAARVSHELLKEQVTNSQARAADQIANYIDLWFTLETRMLSQQALSFELRDLDDRKMAHFQQMVFLQATSAQIVGIINSEGAELTPSLYLTQPGEGHLSSKESISPERFTAFRKAQPLKKLQAWLAEKTSERRLVIGRPAQRKGREGPVLPVIVPGPRDVDINLTTELDLDMVMARFKQAADSGYEVALLDRFGAEVIHLGGTGIEPERFRPFLAGSACDMVEYTSASGEAMFGACSPVGRAGWLVVVAEPASIFTQAQDAIQNRTLYIAVVAGILAIILGSAFSRTMVDPVVDLKNAALKVSEGDLGFRVTPEGPEEVKDLSRAFNYMSGRLARNQSEIEENRAAIAAFNLELQRQLAAQELQLTEAHQRLVQSARLAAVGEMGAGLAHELNNPLAGILGLVQVLQAKGSEYGPTLGNIESQAQRCREIVAHLLRFSRGEGPSGPADQREWTVVDLDQVVREVVTLVRGASREAGVELEHAPVEGLQVRCDREAMGTALAQLLTSLRAACGQGGAVAIQGSQAGEQVCYELKVRGEAVNLATDDWMASGMGFWFARQVLAAHGGRLDEPSEPVRGTEATWRITLPRNG